MATSSLEALAQSMIDNLPEKTGTPLEQWQILLAESHPAKHGEIVKHLKSAHKVTPGYSHLIAHNCIAGKEGQEPNKRLEMSGSFNGMVSHRVRLTQKSEVNTELKKCLRQPYYAA
jgi:Domain of unknown function (DUF4287)